MRKSQLNPILKYITNSILIIIAVTISIGIILLILMGVAFSDNNSSNTKVTDSELYENFENNKDSFNSIVDALDSLQINFYTLDSHNTVLELDSLMVKTGISRIYNRQLFIEFTYHSQGGILTSKDIGYIYFKKESSIKKVIKDNDIINCDTINCDLDDFITEIDGNCHLIKTIDDNWFIELIYDR